MDEEMRALLRAIESGAISDVDRVKKILHDAKNASLADWMLMERAQRKFMEPSPDDSID